MSSLMVAFGVLTLAFIWSDSQRRHGEARANLSRVARTVDKLVHSEISADIGVMKTALESLTHDKELLRLFEEKDRRRLLQRAALPFEVMSARSLITHFYFHRVDHTTFLRLHDTGSFGDSVERITLKEAEATGLPSHGVEQGLTGGPVLRVVYPVAKDGKRIGYMELGREFSGIVQKIENIVGVKALVLSEKSSVRREHWERKNKIAGASWDLLPDHVIVASGMPVIPAKLKELRPLPAAGNAYVIENLQILSENSTFDVIIKPLRGHPERVADHIVFFHDSSANVAASARSALLTISVGFLLMISLLGLFYFFLGNVEQVVALQQASLVASSKMVSLGEMAGGVAHEINNPLAVIKNSASQLTELLGDPQLDLPALKTLAGTIESTSDRIAKIVQGLRVFCWNEADTTPQPADLGKVIDDTVSICLERFKAEGIELTLSKGNDAMMRFLGHDTQISQVLLNLLNNARDAVEPLKEKWVRVSVRTNEHWLEIRVTDSGRGISPENAKKLFQPFYSTKEIGKGTGLGLSISLGIMRKHEGELKLDPRHPNTCFVLRLPRLKENEPKNTAAA